MEKHPSEGRIQVPLELLDQFAIESLLICDAAEALNGKLYILGGGWDWVHASHEPVQLCFAIRYRSPLELVGQQLEFRIDALHRDESGGTDYGYTIHMGALLTLPPIPPNEGTFGGAFTSCFAIPLIRPGRYEFTFRVEGVLKASTFLRVIELQEAATHVR